MDRIEYFIEFYKNSLEIKDIDPSIWMANYIVDRMELNEEQILWFCFLCSITYHLPAAYLLINEYPDLESAGIERLNVWWKDAQYKIPFQRDKLKQRKFLPETVESYQNLVRGSQKIFFNSILCKDSGTNFYELWNVLYKDIKHFGRFSVWNWAQMLKEVAKYDIESPTLMLGEDNSESHTHGLCYAFGKDEWAKKIRYVDEQGKKKKIVHVFSQEEKEYLENESKKLYKMLEKENLYVSNFNIETVACAFKKLFRERDSRYVGYYLDRQAEDIISIQDNWKGVDWQLLWDARKEMLESYVQHNEIDSNKFKMRFEDKIQKPNKERKLWE